ncbi:partial Minor extracellular protease vpr, partial [Thermoflexales bacterium]
MKTNPFFLAVIFLAVLITSVVSVQALSIQPGPIGVFSDPLTVPATTLPVDSGIFSETVNVQALTKNGAMNRHTHLKTDRVIGETNPDSIQEAIYIVQLADQPLATYQGNLANLPATSLAVTNEPKLNMQSPASRLYRRYLGDKQAQFLQAAQRDLNHPLEVVYQYHVVFNGLAVTATPVEVTRLLELPGVVSIQRDYWRYPATDTTVGYLGVDGIWDGAGTGLPGTKGDGVIVGIIDSGIWPEHPSFADYGAYPPPPAKWQGTCQQPADNSPGYQCNNKLIGVQYFLNGYITSVGGAYDGLFHSGRDDNGHGTHVASIVAGNESVSAYIYGVPRGQVSGMAPRAYVASYKALGPGGGAGSDLTAAIDKAVADGVDVINYSIVNNTASDPWVDSDAVAFLNAREAGVFVVTAAGNAGPGASTIGSPANAPWVTSVGAGYFNRLFLSTITVTVGTGVVTTTHVYTGATATPGVTNFDLVDTRGITDTNGHADGSCDAVFPAGMFDWNDAVLCDRGGISSAIHGNLIQQSGGGAVVLYNTEDQYDFDSSLHPIPTVVILRSTWVSIKSLIDSHPTATLKITFGRGRPVNSHVPQDTVTGFSSRGPNINETTNELINVLKPDVTAPGIHVLAGASPEYVMEFGGGTGRYGMQNQLFQVIQGTSLSSAHVAGLGALLKALHSDWSPSEIQSALMLTGLTSNQYEREASGDSTADPFDIGGGRILVANAAQAAFVLDETKADYAAADPELGGDPAALNLASLVQTNCLSTCTWVRVITSTRSSGSINWNINTTGLSLSVEPTNFQLGVGATQRITVTANAGSLGFNNWGFGEVRFSGEGQQLHFTVAARSVAGLAPRSVEIETRRNQGIYQVEDLQSAVSGPLTVTTHSGTPLTVSGSIAPDPTNAYPYDNLAQVYTTTVNVSPGAKGLDVSITASTAPDLNMYVGFDTNGNGHPDASEELCSSTFSAYREHCSLPGLGQPLTPGNYWILVQNWTGSGAPFDDFTLEHAVLLPDGGGGPIQVSASTNVTVGVPYSLTLSWNLPDLQTGDIRHEVIDLTANGVDLNEIEVILTRLEDDVAKLAQISSGQHIQPGDIVTYAVTLDPDPVTLSYNNGSATYILTDTLPAGMTYVPGSASITPASVDGNQIVWQIPVETDRRYRMSTNRQDSACDTGFGGYANLADYGLKPRSTLSGDNIVRHVDEFYGGSIPFQFFGTDYSSLYFTDNGYLVSATSSPTNTGANVAIPNPAIPNNLVAGLWRDFEVVYSETNNYGITVAGAGGGNLVLVEYDNIYPKGSSITNSLDLEVIFRRQPSDTAGNYEVVFAYANVNLPDQVGTIGLENAAGSAGNSFAFNDVQNLEGLVICFDWTNGEKITYAAHVDAGISTPAVLTNLLSHYINSGGVRQTTATITVTDVPISGLSAINDSPTQLGDVTHFTATLNAGANVTYTWDFGDGIFGSGATTSHVYPALSTYTATVTATNSAGSVVAMTPVTIITIPFAQAGPDRAVRTGDPVTLD